LVAPPSAVSSRSSSATEVQTTSSYSVLFEGVFAVTIDFAPVRDNTIKMEQFAQDYSVDDLRALTRDLLGEVRSIIDAADDQQVLFLPFDPDANDPAALPGEEHIGWSLAHLVLHVTASAEESAGISSLLARGIVYGREPRLRYEPYWKNITGKAQVVQRLDECERICLAYLDAWPDAPHLNNYRETSEASLERNGRLNAVATYLYGFRHMDGHLAQFREALRQALQA
jgi:hypothetical protein